MIVIIISVIISVAVLISAFVAFSPNIQHLTETDFMGRADSNAFLYGLNQGQLSARAGNLTVNVTKTIPTELRSKAGVTQNWINITIDIDNNGTISAGLIKD